MKFYLREAGVLTKDNQFISKVRRASELAHDHNLNLQITLNQHYFSCELDKIENELIEILRTFDSVLVHLHTSYENKFGSNNYTFDAIEKYKSFAEKCNNINGLCLHPDLVDDFSVLKEFVQDEEYFGIEGLGYYPITEKPFGNRFEELKKLLDENPSFSIVLDTAHIQEMVKFNEPELREYFRHFNNRIREIHISQTGNFYSVNKMGEEFSTYHSLLNLNENNFLEIIKEECEIDNVSLVMEGVVPFGNYGEDLLKKENNLFNKVLL